MMDFYVALGEVCDSIAKVGDCFLAVRIFIGEVLVGIVAVF